MANVQTDKHFEDLGYFKYKNKAIIHGTTFLQFKFTHGNLTLAESEFDKMVGKSKMKKLS
jgi:hypothetical protein